jgi:L-aspartate oxidase
MELAPRDVVARAIDAEIKRFGLDYVHLDISHESPEFVREHFPTISEACRSAGLDLARDLVPVGPAAHYLMGGVETDVWGRTSLPGLFAAGETACTGVHGANRLASNSLLEAASFAYHAGRTAIDRLASIPARADLPPWDPGKASQPDEQVVNSQVWDEIRRFMWNYVGIVRTNRRLARARMRIDFVQDEIQRYYWDFAVTGDLVELRNLATVAQCVVDCALQRRESRGLHFTLDYPDADKRFIADSVVQRRF